MNNLLETFEKKQIERLTGKKRIPTFRPGDTLKVTLER
jgi:ribosomal protein L19